MGESSFLRIGLFMSANALMPGVDPEKNKRVYLSEESCSRDAI